MICPDTEYDCDNPGCRHGGCQGRRPHPPLLRAQAGSRSRLLPAVEPASMHSDPPTRIGSGRDEHA
jgi:hypothetical protein